MRPRRNGSKPSGPRRPAPISEPSAARRIAKWAKRSAPDATAISLSVWLIVFGVRKRRFLRRLLEEYEGKLKRNRA